MWEKASGSGWRSCLAWLRNRYCFLQTYSGILRCESVQKAELSDLLSIDMQKSSDIHNIELLVMQIATGKTNQGRRLYSSEI